MIRVDRGMLKGRLQPGTAINLLMDEGVAQRMLAGGYRGLRCGPRARCGYLCVAATGGGGHWLRDREWRGQGG
ncbi:hypothetical protein [Cupriavidus sp. 8B]